MMVLRVGDEEVLIRLPEAMMNSLDFDESYYCIDIIDLCVDIYFFCHRTW